MNFLEAMGAIFCVVLVVVVVHRVWFMPQPVPTPPFERRLPVGQAGEEPHPLMASFFPEDGDPYPSPTDSHPAEFQGVCRWCGGEGYHEAYDGGPLIACVHCRPLYCPTGNMTCDRPPAGWWCSRGKGHEGPCAARPLKIECKEDASVFHADFSEHLIDTIGVIHDIWFMEHITGNGLDAPDEACRTVAGFVDWVTKYEEKQLHAKRAPDDMSFFERREKIKAHLESPKSSGKPDCQKCGGAGWYFVNEYDWYGPCDCDSKPVEAS